MREIVRGDAVIFSYQGKIFACAQSGTLTTNTNLIGKSTIGSGDWEESKAVSQNWDANANGVIYLNEATDSEFPDLMELKLNMTEILFGIVLTGVNGAEVSYYGNAIITAISASGTVNNAAAWTINLKGTGALQRFPAPQNFRITGITFGGGFAHVAMAWDAPIVTPLSYTLNAHDLITDIYTDVTGITDLFYTYDQTGGNAARFRLKAVYADGESAYTKTLSYI